MSDSDAADWQQFVVSRSRCSLYHDIGWKDVIEKAYGHRTCYLVARTGGKVTGILPLVIVRSRLFGNSMTSLPFVDFAGVVADDEDSTEALVSRALALAAELGVDYVELRQVEALAGDFEAATHKVLMTLELCEDQDILWSRLSSERRNRVRRAAKSGLTVRREGPDAIEAFYDIWTRNMRDLGSPPHSLEFFRRVLEAFGERCTVLLVEHEARFIGAALAMVHGQTLSLPWVSSLRECFRLYPNNILYWDAMCMAVARGLKTFDFGRSTRDSGTFEFKQRWGAVPTPLYWQRVSSRGGEHAETSDVDRFRFAVELWKRIPVPITRWMGPSLRKGITA